MLRYSVAASDAGGAVVEGAPVDYSAMSFETRADMGASIYPDGAFVAERPGLYRVTATVAGRTGQALVEVVDRGMEHEVIVTGRGLVADRPTSDLWAFTGNDGRDYVYTGTHAGGPAHARLGRDQSRQPGPHRFRRGRRAGWSTT